MMRKMMFSFFLGLVTILFWGHAAMAAEKLPSTVSIGTHPVGSFFNIVGTAAAKGISDHTQIRGIPKPMAGPTAWLPYMERGDIELGVLNVWDAEKGYLGESIYEKLSGKKGFSVRLLAVTVPNLCGSFVAKDSGIFSHADLKGKRVSGNFPTPSLQAQAEAFLANGNLEWKDVIPVPVNSIVEAVKMVMDGRADSSGTTALGTGIVEELNAKKGARFLGVDISPQALERTRKFHPGYPYKVKPDPRYTGVEKEQYAWAYDIYLIAGEQVPDNVIYLITKALWENYKDFDKVNQLLKDWVPDRFVSKEAVIPYHPGAIKFYKEKGVWTKEMEEIQKKLLSKKKA
ncbi:MAG: TAXI family TRAP transporter solute-binding subunit [Deltaproteobacteria bacterium]|nr:TAXI family TRAP transporter solute-binding subunit [Deltaproteobacteria bacterium]